MTCNAWYQRITPIPLALLAASAGLMGPPIIFNFLV